MFLAHLCVGRTDAFPSSTFAVENVDAALTVVLQRRSNCQIPKTICVQIRQYSKGRPKPSSLRCIPSQY